MKDTKGAQGTSEELDVWASVSGFSVPMMAGSGRANGL